MPSCRDITLLLVAEPDGTLDAQALARIEAHVATCTSCRQQRAVLAAVPGALRAATAAVAPPDPGQEWARLRERIQETDAKLHAAKSGNWQLDRDGRRLDSEKRSRPFGRQALAWGLPLAAAAAVAVVAFVHTVPSSSPTAIANTSQPALSRAEGAGLEAAPSDLVYVDQESGWLIVWADTPTG